MKYLLSSLIFILLIPIGSKSQDSIPSSNGQGIVTRAIILDGDTVPMIWLAPVRIFGPMIFKSKAQAITFTRLVRYVKKVYPYAKFVGIKVNQYNQYLNTIPDERTRQKEIKRIEDELRAQFEVELKKLTVMQGKILVKLIYRQTGQSTYNIVKDFRGTLTAVFWQSFGSLFGYNLKVGYDPYGEDRDIENIVIMIENGAI